MRVPPVRVNLPRRLADVFKRKVKEAFPREEYAIVLADVDPDGVYHVEDLYYPEGRERYCTENEINRLSSWFDDAAKIAEVQGLTVIGDIHSHCYDAENEIVPGAEPSETDWLMSVKIAEQFTSDYRLIGICTMVKKNGKYRGTIRFWPVTIGVETKIT